MLYTNLGPTMFEQNFWGGHGSGPQNQKLKGRCYTLFPGFRTEISYRRETHSLKCHNRISVELQPQSHPPEPSQVAFMITNLPGRACEWENQTPNPSVKGFSETLRRIFDHSAPVRDTAQGLLALQQSGVQIMLSSCAPWRLALLGTKPP